MSRLASDVLVGALLRRVGQQGGFGAVLARGDATSGAVLVIGAMRGADVRAVERRLDLHGRPELVAAGPANPTELTDYWRRRRERDPDLWVIELDHPDAERIAAAVLIDATD